MKFITLLLLLTSVKAYSEIRTLKNVYIYEAACGHNVTPPISNGIGDITIGYKKRGKMILEKHFIENPNLCDRVATSTFTMNRDNTAPFVVDIASKRAFYGVYVMFNAIIGERGLESLTKIDQYLVGDKKYEKLYKFKKYKNLNFLRQEK